MPLGVHTRPLTPFNKTVGLKMSETRDRMIVELKALVIPQLKKLGFRGSFPHFRRPQELQIDLLTFQFSRWGGSFVVEVAKCSAEGVTTHWGKFIPPNKVNAHDVFPRLRLGSNPPKEVDHWFDFESASYGEQIYRMMSEEVLMCMPQAERFWDSKE